MIDKRKEYTEFRKDLLFFLYEKTYGIKAGMKTC